MTHLRSHFADLLVTFVILVGQIPIAFLFWRKRRQMPLAVAILCSLALLLLWTAVLFASPYRFFVRYHMLEFVPYDTRNLLIAVGNTWGILSILSIAVYSLFRVFAGLRVFAGGRETPHSPGRRRMIQAAGTVVAGAPFIAGAFGAIVERTNFQVKEIDLPVPNLHPDFEGFRIGQLSDLHCSPWLSVRDAARVVDMLNEQKPHLTVVTGDLITEPGDPLDAAIREVGRLRADLGVLGCHGNHEIYVDCEEYASNELAKRGIRILRHETQEIRRGNGILNVAGIDYQRKLFGPYLIRG